MKRIFASSNSGRRQPNHQRGSIMVLTSVTIMGMIGLLALSIDLGFLFSVKTQFENGVNAGALAGGAGLRVAIEPDPTAPQQTLVVQSLAVQYAGLNRVNRYPGVIDTTPGQDGGEELNPANQLNINPADVTVVTNTDIPQVKITTTLEAPLFFAGIFGFNNMNIGNTTVASLLPVDGGTGTIIGGAKGAGCWRPLFLPDTFYDSSYQPIRVGTDVGGIPRMPNQSGDYYRSRFAAGSRNLFPFVDSVSGTGAEVTGIRDTQLQNEIGTKTIMGQYITLDHNYFFVPNLSGLPPVTSDAYTTQDFANFGYCGKIRIGDEIPVYAFDNLSVRDEVRLGLIALKSRTLDGDFLDANLETQFRYVKSASYPVPNSHGAIIPILFYNPIPWRDPATAKSATILKVTNFGLFFMKDVLSNGDISGFFVREIISGGTPIASTNMETDSAGFKRHWLPMSVQLLK
jgi:Flp pilus assembly protein TadG